MLKMIQWRMSLKRLQITVITHCVCALFIPCLGGHVPILYLESKFKRDVIAAQCLTYFSTNQIAVLFENVDLQVCYEKEIGTVFFLILRCPKPTTRGRLCRFVSKNRLDTQGLFFQFLHNSDVKDCHCPRALWRIFFFFSLSVCVTSHQSFVKIETRL